MSEQFCDRLPRLAALSARILGWRPNDFWTATPAELAMSLADPDDPVAAPMGRDELNTLMERDSHG